MAYQRLAKPTLFRLDPERAHHATVTAARTLGVHPLLSRAAQAGIARSPTTGRSISVGGITVANRVGLAAGLDKDAVAVPAWQALGFGHLELGTVTAIPQPGNPKPRMARLPLSEALINRMGFNNQGTHALAQRLRKLRDRGEVRVPIGVSLGKSKVTPVDDAVEDYVVSVRAVAGLADYLAVNVSSPNTPGLRSLQDAEPLRELLQAVVAEAKSTPVWLKVAPDLTFGAIDDVLEVASEAGVAAIIATNTTLSRAGVAAEEAATAQQPGGLSGAPLHTRSVEVVRYITENSDFETIGVGGIRDRAGAQRFIDAGAALVQVYSGLVYRGPGLVAELADL
ncbi:quinone-dependent dihydroorotate dehydrogenase [Ornithinimicrobium sp. Arc0846-15]|nr:quinone-dependent dihydroorotate dehydrogenase [Ornithinimicrobium laminariae]